MDDKVKEQILKVRDTGLTNMFDTRTVQKIANDMNFYELVIYLEEHKKEYSRFILTGETATNKALNTNKNIPGAEPDGSFSRTDRSRKSAAYFYAKEVPPECGN